jgi:hypothetical protein
VKDVQAEQRLLRHDWPFGMTRTGSLSGWIMRSSTTTPPAWSDFSV